MIDITTSYIQQLYIHPYATKKFLRRFIMCNYGYILYITLR